MLLLCESYSEYGNGLLENRKGTRYIRQRRISIFVYFHIHIMLHNVYYVSALLFCYIIFFILKDLRYHATHFRLLFHIFFPHILDMIKQAIGK